MKNARRPDWKIGPEYALLVCIGLTLSLFGARPLRAQAPETDLILHVQTTLALVDGVAEQQNPITHNPMILTTIEKNDFRLFDNGREVAVQTFDVGVEHTTRPIALWLIVQCNMGFPPDWGSTFMRGQTQNLKPALQHLDKADLIGVAHWCDDGQAKADVTPGTDINVALKGVDAALGAEASFGSNRAGELAMQRMIHLIVEKTKELTPARLPVLLFLYGDHGATDPGEAASIVVDLLQTSGVVFGLNNGTFYQDPLESIRGGKTWGLVHYYSQRTGGQCYSTWRPELFAQALDYIITQLHLRYTLSFQPSKLDGKTHELRVELTRDAQKRFPKTTLRFRREYIPLKPAQ